MNCPTCNAPTVPGAVFCDNCGQDLRVVAQAPVAPPAAAGGGGSILCSSCNHQNMAGSAFCENCGTPLTGQAPPVAPPPPPQPVIAPPAAGLVCSNCGSTNTPGATFCENCGNKLGGAAPQPQYSPPTPQPVYTPSPPQVYTPPSPAQQPTYAPPSSSPVLNVTGRFVLQSSNVSLPLPGHKPTAFIGREDPVSNNFPEIDLDPHGGLDKGVGRQHARLFIQGGQLMIEDLNSVNGTLVNKQKLLPKQPRPLNNGDEVYFGQFIVHYYSS